MNSRAKVIKQKKFESKIFSELRERSKNRSRDRAESQEDVGACVVKPSAALRKPSAGTVSTLDDT